MPSASTYRSPSWNALPPLAGRRPTGYWRTFGWRDTPCKPCRPTVAHPCWRGLRNTQGDFHDEQGRRPEVLVVQNIAAATAAAGRMGGAAAHLPRRAARHYRCRTAAVTGAGQRQLVCVGRQRQHPAPPTRDYRRWPRNRRVARHERRFACGTWRVPTSWRRPVDRQDQSRRADLPLARPSPRRQMPGRLADIPGS